MLERRVYLAAVLLVSAAFPLHAQLDPEGSQVISYFPQLADGGSQAQQWQTTFTFVNPDASSSALASLQLFGNDGSSLKLDFGNGAVSGFDFALAPQGSATFRTTGASTTISTGWAIVISILPLQGVVQYHYSVNGVPQQGVSAQATPASHLFRSPATINTGVAVANTYSNLSIPVRISAIDSSGKTTAATSISIGPLAHQSFTVAQIFPDIPTSFQGTVVLVTDIGRDFVAWTLSSDSGVLSSYPASGLTWPNSHYEQIWKVWLKLLNATNQLYGFSPWPKLVVDYSTGSINSFANPSTNEVHIFMNLAELISDSESELAFVVGHEIGHIIQAKRNQLVFVPGNIEQDADQYGVYLALTAGYDPYAGAGALAKLSMASGDAGLVSQNFDNLSTDPHGSFNNRLDQMFTYMQAVCSLPVAKSTCAAYKAAIHPHLPIAAPLDASGRSNLTEAEPGHLATDAH